MRMVPESDFNVLIDQITYQKFIIEKQKELLEVQNELIHLLMSGQYNPIVPPPVDPNKWNYNPGPTCDCMKGE